MISTIVFDAFGTLFQVTNGGSANYVMKQVMNCGHDVDQENFLQEWKEYYKNHTSKGRVFRTEREIFISRIQMFYERYDVRRDAGADVDHLLSGAYEREVYEEVPAVIAYLHQKYNVYIGSNTDNAVLAAVMEKSNITVDQVYTSENLKCYKPEPRFYEKILAENHLDSSEVLFVGDSLTDDVYGPQNVGIHTVWLNRNNKEVPDKVTAIENLRELLNQENHL